MTKLKKIKNKKCQHLPPPPLLLNMTCPCAILSPPFLNFSESPSLKKEGPNYEENTDQK